MKKTLILIVLLILSVPPVGAAFRYLESGMKPPAFEGTDLISGKKISSDLIDGKRVAILVFWATWSQRSLDQLRDLQDILDERVDETISVIAINVENQNIIPEMEERILQQVKELDLRFPCIIDRNLEIFYEFGVIAVPSTAIVDSTGTIRYTPAGYSYSSKDYIIDSIGALLGEKTSIDVSILKIGYQPSNKAYRYFGLARRLANQKVYEDVLENLQMSISEDSLFAAPFNLRGEIYLHLDSFRNAIISYSEAIKRDSSIVVYWAGLGKAYFVNNNLDSAEICLGKALELDSTYTPALLDMAAYLSTANQHEEALTLLNSALELNPMDPTVYYYLGKVYKSRNQIGEAALYLQKGLELLYSK